MSGDQGPVHGTVRSSTTLPVGANVPLAIDPATGALTVAGTLTPAGTGAVNVAQILGAPAPTRPAPAVPGILIVSPMISPPTEADIVRGTREGVAAGATTLIAAVLGKRIYVTSIIVSTDSTTAVRWRLRDGAGGTVLATGWVMASAGPLAIALPSPLRLSVATLLEAENGSAAGVLDFAAQGYTSTS